MPDELISIIEQYNGGRPPIKQILTSTQKKYVFKSLLSYNEDDKETIYSIYPELFKETDLFPFASDAAGNLVCYNQSTQKYVLLNHETDKEEDIIDLAMFKEETNNEGI